MIRNVVVHITNEQPLLADLYDVPHATDVGLLCTNLRSMDGKRPIFIDKIENAFFFPYRAIRFVEMPAGALERHRADGGATSPTAYAAAAQADDDLDSTLPAVIEADAGDDLGLDAGDEIDEDFLRRIRDI